MSDYKDFLSLSVSERSGCDEKIIFTSLGKNTEGRKEAKMVYFPKETADFITSKSSGSFSAAVLSLVDYAIKDLESKNLNLMAQSK